MKKNYNPSYMDENNQYQLNLERTLEVPYNYKGEKEYESTDIESKVLKVRRLLSFLNFLFTLIKIFCTNSCLKFLLERRAKKDVRMNNKMFDEQTK